MRAGRQADNGAEGCRGTGRGASTWAWRDREEASSMFEETAAVLGVVYVTVDEWCAERSMGEGMDGWLAARLHGHSCGRVQSSPGKAQGAPA